MGHEYYNEKNCVLHPYNIHLAWCTSSGSLQLEKLGDILPQSGAKIEAIINQGSMSIINIGFSLCPSPNQIQLSKNPPFKQCQSPPPPEDMLFHV